MLQICSTIHIFTDHSYAIGVVHRLVEVVAEKLEHVWMTLHFEKLNGFFLYTDRVQHVIKKGTCVKYNDGIRLFTLYSLSLSSVLASTSLMA